MNKGKLFIWFLMYWIVFSVIFYGIVKFSFLLKSYTDLGKVLVLWTPQLVAPFCAYILMRVSRLETKKRR